MVAKVSWAVSNKRKQELPDLPKLESPLLKIGMRENGRAWCLRKTWNTERNLSCRTHALSTAETEVDLGSIYVE